MIQSIINSTKNLKNVLYRAIRDEVAGFQRRTYALAKVRAGVVGVKTKPALPATPKSVEYRPVEKLGMNPEYWEESIIKVHGQDILRVRSRSKKFRTRHYDPVPIKYFPGFKIKANDYDHPNIHALIERGVPFSIDQFPDPGAHVNCLSDYKRFMEALLFDPRFQEHEFYGNKPYVIPHSIKAQVFTDLCRDDAFLQKFDAHYCGAGFLAAHYKSPHHLISEQFTHAGFDFLQARLKDKVIGSTKLEQDITDYFDFPMEDPDDLTDLTWRQSFHFRNKGLELRNAAINGEFPERIKQMNFTHILSKSDTTSDAETIRTIAHHMGADVVEFPNVKHNMLVKSPKVVATIRHIVRDTSDAWNSAHDRYAHPNQIVLSRETARSFTEPAIPLLLSSV